ncbi:MAG: DUF2304 family protein [Bdellovibrionales bacterium]
MLFQIIYSIVAFVLFIFFWRRSSALKNKIISLSILCSSYFVWNPDLTSRIAELFGVTRGADLLSYFHFMLFIVFLSWNYIQFAKQNFRISELVSELAIRTEEIDRMKKEIKNH